MSPTTERQASIDREVELLENELLRGIPLDARELARAREIIRADVVTRRTIDAPPATAPFAALDRSLECMRMRDTELAGLLSTDAQRASLAENVALQQRTLSELRQRAEQQFRREQAGG